VHHACFLRSQNVVRALQTIYPTILSFSHLALCATASTFIVIFCWIQITKAQKAAMSSRTIKMEKQLMFSLGIQSFIPNIIFLICLGVLLLCLLIGRSWMGELRFNITQPLFIRHSRIRYISNSIYSYGCQFRYNGFYYSGL
jgi:hypothetical protein